MQFCFLSEKFTMVNTLKIILLFTAKFLFSQTGDISIVTPKKLDTIISQKIIIDRINFKKKTYTIQIYYGNFDEASYTLKEFEERFPKIKAEILFETPNYKIRVGKFKSESDASKTLEKLNFFYKDAFILKI